MRKDSKGASMAPRLMTRRGELYSRCRSFEVGQRPREFRGSDFSRANSHGGFAFQRRFEVQAVDQRRLRIAFRLRHFPVWQPADKLMSPRRNLVELEASLVIGSS